MYDKIDLLHFGKAFISILLSEEPHIYFYHLTFKNNNAEIVFLSSLHVKLYSDCLRMINCIFCM